MQKGFYHLANTIFHQTTNCHSANVDHFLVIHIFFFYENIRSVKFGKNPD